MTRAVEAFLRDPWRRGGPQIQRYYALSVEWLDDVHEETSAKFSSRYSRYKIREERFDVKMVEVKWSFVAILCVM
jgi:hypothetical protein